MKRKRLILLASMIAVSGLQQFAMAHCEVPCGIYGDQRRFEQMLEDTATIEKAINSIRSITDELRDGPSATNINQSVRWITTKEAHATNIQQTIAQYFMTQRIKPSADRYSEKLASAHAVMIAAMKCKQDADPATAQNLRKAIHKFYEAYEGKKIATDHDH